MNKLSNDILLNIDEFLNNKNLRYASKNFENFLNDLKMKFIDYLDNNELSIRYQLKRFDRKFINFDKDKYFEPKIEIEPIQKIIINRNNFYQDYAEIIDSNIVFKRYFLENLLPQSTIDYSDSGRNLHGTITYWEVNFIDVNDNELFKKYIQIK